MPDASAVDIAIRGKRRTDVVLAELAGRQHGVVARRQLLGMGYERSAIDRRVAAGRLLPLRRGVYAVGHKKLSGRGRWMAAVLASGDAAALSHRSAAALWDLIPMPAGKIDVIAPGGGRGGSGIALHCMPLDSRDRTTRDAVAVTTPSRTLVDLAAVVTPDRLERAAEQADRAGKLDLNSIHRILGATPRRPGAPALRQVLGPRLETNALLTSELERRFLRLCRDAGLPLPAMNAWVEDMQVDAFWASARLVVELDGFDYHSTRPAFERDHHRRERLLLAGYRVLSFTWRRLESEPAGVAASIRALLRSTPAYNRR